MKRKIWVVGLSLAIVSTISFATVFLTDIFLVQNSNIVAGDVLVDEEYLAESICGRNIFLVDIGEVKARLETNPEIKTVYIERNYPDSIDIEVVSREKAIGIEYMNGVIGIASDGCVMNFETRTLQNRDGVSSDCLIVKDFEFERFKVNSIFITEDYRLLENLILLAQFLKSDIDEKVDCAIIEDNHLVLQINEDFRADFGKIEEPIEGKLVKFKLILEDLGKKDINRGIINMEYENSPVYYPVQ